MSTDVEQTGHAIEQWVAEQVAKFESADLRRAATLLTSLAGAAA